TEEGGPYSEDPVSESEAIQKGEAIATKHAKDVRQIEGLEEVPLMIALYQEDSISSQVHGNCIQKVNDKDRSNDLGKWEDLKEEYVLFPSSESKEDYIDDYEKVNKFGTGVGDYFPNYVGIIGEGLYVDDNLTDLKINIPI